MSWAPVVLFTYDRPVHTRRTLEALAANAGADASDLFVYSDAPATAASSERVRAVREYLGTVTGFRSVTVVERETNLGLADSVIAGVTDVLRHAGSVVVVEDDLLTTTSFLAFVNSALSTYEGRPEIFSVTGYNYPLRMPPDYREDVYLSYRSTSWGWGTWRDRWEKVDWSVSDFADFARDAPAQERFRRGGDDLPRMLEMQMAGELDSWSIRFDYAHFKHDAFCVHPVRSKVQNIGFDGSGVHCETSNYYRVELDPSDRPLRLPPDLAVDASVLSAFNEEFRPTQGSIFRRSRLRSRRIIRRLVSRGSLLPGTIAR